MPALVSNHAAEMGQRYDSRMTWAIGLVLKPLMLILLFGAARLLAMGIHRILKPGKFKTWLFQDRGDL